MRKKILIIGKNSYIGKSFADWLNRWPEAYRVEFISVRNDEWQKKDFVGYDVILHVAAIVHKKENPSMQQLYIDVNSNLPIKIANKAKSSGVEQFIFMSSMSVYGLTAGVIKKDSPVEPNSLYGKSKAEAERQLELLRTDKFKVALLRPPMIYGPNSPGNYSLLSMLAKKTILFPYVKNERSMIFIDNLSEFIRLIINHNEDGLFFPQNQDYVNTTHMVESIAKISSKKLYLTKIFNYLLRLASNKVNILNKVFGSLTYDKSMSNHYNFGYCVSNFEESIKLSEESY